MRVISQPIFSQYLDYVERGCNNSDVICSDELRSPEKPPDPRLVYGGKCEHRVFWNVSGYLYTYNDLFNNSVTPYQVYYRESTIYITIVNYNTL